MLVVTFIIKSFLYYIKYRTMVCLTMDKFP